MKSRMEELNEEYNEMIDESCGLIRDQDALTKILARRREVFGQICEEVRYQQLKRDGYVAYAATPNLPRARLRRIADGVWIEV